MSDKLKESIKYNTEWIRLLMLCIFAIAGVLFSILFSVEKNIIIKTCWFQWVLFLHLSLFGLFTF